MLNIAAEPPYRLFRIGHSKELTLSKPGRNWLAGLGDVMLAIRADPGLLAPALIVVALAVVVGYLAWRFI
ncbi:hypothetical protein [Caulobacter sp. S45]|uniref:hypothetical protein n=1 Tax=Caulobacter sp. S45 TaxID=1641861 RepID=UPI0015777AC5|nr:hypothetical protein [Caulobacter sp. S45]